MDIMPKKSDEELASVEEEQIIELLQKDARMPFVKIAKKVGLSENTVRKRIEKLKKEGYIREFALLLNPKKFGKHVIAIFMISRFLFFHSPSMTWEIIISYGGNIHT